MSSRYAPLPSNPNAQEDVSNELDAAFDDSDSEDEDNITESHPLNPRTTSPPRQTVASPFNPGIYDFDADYDYPPPGSPPRPSAVALPNDIGNSNGITSFTVDSSAQTQRRGWFGRTAASILPTHYVQRFGLGQQAPSGVVGGGGNMDGVFANVTAKPARPVRIQEGDNTYLVPEDSATEAPPSYASAQADSVPPYWETTVHAPFSPDTMGEVVIDSLPTGSFFSFLWNMLVSMSFQFVGFLLTYLLHTTHAARLGSRAGLGFTLIQYGFSIRSKLENTKDGISGPNEDWPEWQIGDPLPSQEEYFKNLTQSHNGTATMPTPEEDANIAYLNSAGISTTEWLAFFLMTIGWFILLTSLLGFWRVKRWEQGILTPQQPQAPITPEQASNSREFASRIESAFGFSLLSGADVRNGLGLGSRDRESEYVVHETAAAGRRESESDEQDALISAESDEGRTIRMREFVAQEQRLQDSLRAASFL